MHRQARHPGKEHLPRRALNRGANQPPQKQRQPLQKAGGIRVKRKHPDPLTSQAKRAKRAKRGLKGNQANPVRRVSQARAISPVPLAHRDNRYPQNKPPPLPVKEVKEVSQGLVLKVTQRPAARPRGIRVNAQVNVPVNPVRPADPAADSISARSSTGATKPPPTVEAALLGDR